jgi:CubicO group peptidase (beta-lactamase class C family)
LAAWLLQRQGGGRSLDDEILGYLPPAWRDEVSEPYRALTIGNLVQHRGGFDKNAPEVDGRELTVRERLAQDPPEHRIAGSRKYSNMSYTLFDYMPTFLRGRADIDEPSASLSDDDYDAEYQKQGTRSNEKYYRDQIVTPIGVAMSCNHAEHAGSNYARNYNGPNVTGEGKLVNQTDEPGCAVGGAILSPEGMLKFLRVVSGASTIVNRETWKLMARPGKERYGWPQTPDVPRDISLPGELNHGLAFGHNGSRWGGKAKAQVYVFPNDMSAVAIANSKGSENATSLSDVLLDAYKQLLPRQ